MAPQTALLDTSGLELSRMTDALSNMPPAETQLQRRHRLVYHNTANAANKNMTLDAHFQTVHTTGTSNNNMQQENGCEYICIEVDCRQLTILYRAGVCRDLRDQFIATDNGKPPWSTKAFGHTVCEIQHHDVVSCEVFADEFGEK